MVKGHSLPAFLQQAHTDPCQVTRHWVFSDASYGVGFTITLGNRWGAWRAWRLILGWQTLEGHRDIAWAETIGFECLVRLLCLYGDGNTNYKIYGDNITAITKCWGLTSLKAHGLRTGVTL